MNKVNILRLDSSSPGFSRVLDELLERAHEQVEGVEGVVEAIISDIRKRGDEALLEYTRRFDGLGAASAAELELSAERLQQAVDSITLEQRQALLMYA